jgi:hypothetical protein
VATQQTSAGKTLPTTIYFCVGDRALNVYGYAWRLGWSGTSFYLKLRHRPMARIKISLHSPAAGKGQPGYKIGLDSSAPKERADDPFAALVGAAAPGWFPGRQVARGVTHVIRFRSTWDLFAPGLPSGPSLNDVKEGSAAALIAIPPAGYAVDVDIYVSERRPFWPQEAAARRDNACLRALRNNAGEYVTGVSVKRAVLTSPTPPTTLAGEPVDENDRTRGVGTAVDDEGFLWVREQWMSKAVIGATSQL